ncbi:hypothetical protein [Winogradskyella flava]|uniref:hypothetical protein n=1 Tax=Winogradskyella flava TaxID=1884876 RepID=UPI002491F56F|nr:hypothetical protein [Winogradskyella flava]
MKNLKKLGNILSKSEQKQINGGNDGCLPGFYEACTPEEEAGAAAGDPWLICKCGTSLGWDPQWDIIDPRIKSSKK